MLTTAGLWLEQSKSRVYLRVILYKESKPTTDLLHFWVEDVKESFRSAVYRHQPHSCKRKQKANRLLSFSFSVMPQVSFQQTTDSSTSIRRKKTTNTKASSVGKEMVGHLLLYLCCKKYTGLQMSHMFLQIKYTAEYAYNPKTLLIYHRPQIPPPLNEKGAFNTLSLHFPEKLFLF